MWFLLIINFIVRKCFKELRIITSHDAIAREYDENRTGHLITLELNDQINYSQFWE